MFEIVKRFVSIIKGDQSKKQEILIIDNRFHSLEFLKNALCRQYRVLIAQDKDEGFCKARLYTPSMIILNIRLNKEETLSLCVALRKLHETKDIPILMIAEKGSDSNITEFYIHKIEGFLIEPFSKREILSQVQTALLERK